MGLNLSEWALGHRSWVLYAMLAASLAGALAFYRLGRDEDPPFTVRTMVVKAAWPGATIDETLLLVTERLERTLQETAHLDFLRSFTKPGVTTIFVNPRDDSRRDPRRLVPGPQARCRHALHLAVRRRRSAL
jgi:multidrug efflux pump subunit AcrB